MYFGTAYYPEHWPEERADIDLDMMEKAGISMIRIGEFAWSTMEPREGIFDFDWIDNTLLKASQRGIKAVLGTPTASPPKWLMDKYPDIYTTDYMGIQVGFGHRIYRCTNNPDFRRSVERLVGAMADRYAGDSRISGWQIDNEMGIFNTGRCFCQHCRKAFQDFLKDKYNTIDELNTRWGTVFSNQIYPSFDSLILPVYTTFNMHNPGMMLDYRRFISHSLTSFYKLQADLIHRVNSDSRVTTNMMWNGPDVDYYDLVEELDFKAVDLYPNCVSEKIITSSKPAFGYDMIRGFDQGKPFEVFEHQAGTPGGAFLYPSPRPGDFKRWSWQSAARGAEGLVYFRWRTCVFGAEEYWHGILGHDGRENNRYRELCDTSSELGQFESLLDETEIKPKVAIVRCYDCQWTFEIQPHIPGYEYDHHVRHYYNALYNVNIPVDVVGPDADFSRYSLVILPNLVMTSNSLAGKIYAYVDEGGHVIMDYRCGCKNMDNGMTQDILPGIWRELLGIEISDYGIIPDNESQSLEYKGRQFKTEKWFEIIESKEASVISLFCEDFYQSRPAVTENCYGKGRAYYLGTEVLSDGLEFLLKDLAKKVGISPLLGNELPGVEVIERVSVQGNNTFYIVINHNRQSVKIDDFLTLEENSTRILQQENNGKLKILL